MVEIELKAHVADRDACEQKLTALAGKGQPFTKDDAYWTLCPAQHTHSDQGEVRVRREKTADCEQTLVTWKRKEKRDGHIEVNTERQFTADGDLVEDLFAHLGLVQRLYKHKQGLVWQHQGITAELCHVSGGTQTPCKDLGWFLELEIISDDNDNQTIKAAQDRLLNLLEHSGIGKENLESRYYWELLEK